MLRKNSKIAFGGMWVFPGGRIDDADHHGAADVIAAARNAAAREAREEAALVVEPAEMVIFAHWIPPPIAPKRFATWFFAAGVDEHDHIIDDGEIVEGEWMTPEGCLARHHEGEIELAPPTWVTLHTLLGHGDVAATLRFLDERPARHHETHIGSSERGPIAMWKGDAGYDANDPSLEGPRHRLEMFREGYRYIDNRCRVTMPDESLARTGLTAAEVEQRIADGRVNDVPDAPVRTFPQIVRANVLTPVNAIISTLLVLILVAGYPADALFAGVVVTNSLIGIAQEVQARRTLNALAVLSAPKARECDATASPRRSASAGWSKTTCSSSSPAIKWWSTARSSRRRASRSTSRCSPASPMRSRRIPAPR